MGVGSTGVDEAVVMVVLHGDDGGGRRRIVGVVGGGPLAQMIPCFSFPSPRGVDGH